MFGRREELVMGVVNCVDNYRRDIQFNLDLIFKKDLREEMSKNRSLKNIHSGKRCFIIGNGPSLKHYDLSKLTNEFVFTVNYMMRSVYFETLRPNYHFFFDPNIFTLNPNDKIDNDKIKAIHNSIDLYPDIEFFIPYNKKHLASKIIPKANINYIYNNLLCLFFFIIFINIKIPIKTL